MLTLISPVKRRSGLSVEEFHKHWRDVHATLIRDTPAIADCLLGYTQYPSIASAYQQGEPIWDGVAIARYESQQAMDRLFNSPEYQRLLRPDEEKLTDPATVNWLICDNPNKVIG